MLVEKICVKHLESNTILRHRILKRGYPKHSYGETIISWKNMSKKEVDNIIPSRFRKLERLLSSVLERIKGKKISEAYLPVDFKVECYLP